MKRALLGITLVCSVAQWGRGQGTVSFHNSVQTLVRENSFADFGSYIPVVVGKVELLWAPEGYMDRNGFVPTGTVVDVGTIAPGRFSGGILTIPWFPGSVLSAYVRGWSGAASSWEAAVNSGANWGWSAIFSVRTGNPYTTPPELPGSILDSTGNPFTGLSFVLIPEPTSASLFGAWGLLLSGWRGRRERFNHSL